MIWTVSPGCARLAAAWIVCSGALSVPALELEPLGATNQLCDSNTRRSTASSMAMESPAYTSNEATKTHFPDRGRILGSRGVRRNRIIAQRPDFIRDNRGVYNACTGTGRLT